jgi:mono/diheme cytochrome c family protein
MWRPLGVLPGIVLLVVVLPATWFMGTRASTTQGDAARGESAVKHVSVCRQCHSPRSQITGPAAGWRAPMPSFRMNDADARAVAAYLKTLR